MTPVPPFDIPIPCRVVRVIDGDSLTVDCGQGRLSVRIAGIDAPELSQAPWGDQAGQKLRQILSNRQVTLVIRETDRYRRQVGRIFLDGHDIGLQMVQQGAAVVYRYYNRDANYLKMEDQARKERLGVWKTAGAQQKPWLWRRLNPH